jgi:hypothetical protein
MRPRCCSSCCACCAATRASAQRRRHPQAHPRDPDRLPAHDRVGEGAGDVRGQGEERVWTGYLKEVKFWNKERGAEMLARHLSLFNDKLKLTAVISPRRSQLHAIAVSRSSKHPDIELAEDMARFYADPLGFVMYAYPWDTDPALQLVSCPRLGATSTRASTGRTSGRASSCRARREGEASAASMACTRSTADSRGDRRAATASARARSSRGSSTGSCRRARMRRARSPRTRRTSSRRRPGRRSSSGRRSASPRTGSRSPRARARW